jgi:hypothetical protein
MGTKTTTTTTKKPLKLSSLGGLYQVLRAKTVLPLIPSVTRHTHITQLHDS